MKSFLISKQDEGMRLSRFIERTAHKESSSEMYKAFRTKHIKVNKKRTEASYRLTENDVVEIWLNDDMIGYPSTSKLPDFMKASGNVNIIYEDSNLAILHKPVGLYSHPVKDNYADTMISRFLRYLYEKGEFIPSENTFTPALCNRLDRNTEGLLIVGKNLLSTQEINKMITNRSIVKTYYALCSNPSPLNGTYCAFLLDDAQKNKVKIFEDPIDKAQSIKTEFHTIQTNKELSLLEVILHTGRKHQIRAHLAYLKHPVLGDPKYGDAKMNSRYHLSSQKLTSYSLRFRCKEDSLLFYMDNKEFQLPEIPYKEFFL